MHGLTPPWAPPPAVGATGAAGATGRRALGGAPVRGAGMSGSAAFCLANGGHLDVPGVCLLGRSAVGTVGRPMIGNHGDAEERPGAVSTCRLRRRTLFTRHLPGWGVGDEATPLLAESSAAMPEVARRPTPRGPSRLPSSQATKGCTDWEELQPTSAMAWPLADGPAPGAAGGAADALPRRALDGPRACRAGRG